jgi:hypothetical protein
MPYFLSCMTEISTDISTCSDLINCELKIKMYKIDTQMCQI